MIKPSRNVVVIDDVITAGARLTEDLTGPVVSCKGFKQRRRLQSHGEVEEGQEEGYQRKGDKEDGSGYSTCNQVRRSSGEHNHIIGLNADRSASYLCYVGEHHSQSPHSCLAR
jgi:hypothetical protein